MKEELISFIQNSLNINEDIILTVPKNLSFGDFTTNIAMKMSKKLNLSKEEIYNILLKNMNNCKSINKIELVEPGFLNFYMNSDYLINNVYEILNEKENYGNKKQNNIKVNLEYVSANPTGILHLGHARGACYGDSLSRILKCAGYDVTREYYINDAGNQMNNLGVSIKERYKEICGLPFNLPENGYHGIEIVEIAKTIYEKYDNSKLEESTNYFKKFGLNVLLDKIKEDLKNINIEFDKWTSEESLYENNEVNDILDKLISTGKTYEKEDAIWLKTSKYYDDKDRVLVKSDKTYTYLLPDIAYHNNKYKRGYDVLIDVLGADHHGYINRIKSSMKMIDNDPEKLEIKILQMVRLIENGEEVKMSKRTGKTVTINDLREMVGTDALRYFYIMKSLDSQMDFDLTLATTASNENPVFYSQYAHARICSILRNAKEQKIEYDGIKDLKVENAYDLLKKLSEFKSTIDSSAIKRAPHLIVNYLYELATLFHSYYSNNKIITDNLELTKNNLNLMNAIKIVMAKSLYLIGVSAPEKM